VEKVAIIGSGIAGLASAWLLREKYDVQLFESGSYFGGHTNTCLVDEGTQQVPVDTGFIVYNEPNYPNLTALFRELAIESQPTVMSFGVSIDSGEVEYAGSGLNQLFAQRRNLARPARWKMLGEILRFNNLCKERIKEGNFEGYTVGELLRREGFGTAFRDHYLLPMAAAIWSCPTRTMLEFPLESFAHFFRNHGLLDLRNRPQWRSVTGGSQTYVRKILEDLGGRTSKNCRVLTIRRSDKSVELLFEDGSSRLFDQVVVATHADQALKLLERPTQTEFTLLGRFRYQQNHAWLHSDSRLMPRSGRVWSAWNYLADTRDMMTDRVSVTYWMNLLQKLNTERNYFVSLNPHCEPEKVHASMIYEHPLFDSDAISAQPRLGTIQGRRRTWFCGSYFGYGFHEDALASAVAVASELGVAPPWQKTSGIEAA
jgi:predicted NAD/FAD-binding protein